MMSSPSVIKKRKNYSSGDVDEAIKNIQIGDISHAKSVCKYEIPIQTLVPECKNKIDDVEEKRLGSLTVLGEAAEKDLVQWSLVIQKQGLLVGRDMIIQKASEIHCYMFGSIRSVGSVGWGWCDQFVSRQGKLALRTAQVIKRARSKAILEGLQSFFCDLRQHIIERTIKK